MEYKRLNDYLNELKFNKRADLLSTTGKELLIELEHALKQLTLTDVGYCNCDESKQLEEEFEIKHLINDTYQVVGKDSNTIWKQGTMEECNDWVML